MMEHQESVAPGQNGIAAARGSLAAHSWESAAWLPAGRPAAGQASAALTAGPAKRARREADAAQIAEAMVTTWQRIDASLAPVIGSKGMAALYERSCHLTGRTHSWLADAANDPAALKSVVARQNDTDAVLGCSALVQTFDRLLGDLIGPSLAERLLGSACADAASGPLARDTHP
jgi:hypothetical protein